MDNIDKEFAKLTERLGDIKPLEEGLSIAHLSDFADVLANVISHVNRYITRTLAEELDTPPPLTNELIVGISHSFDINVTLADLLCDATCGTEEVDELGFDEDECDHGED